MDKTSTRKLRSGNSMPVIGLGTWQMTKHTSDTIAEALELGYPMIDTSGDYGTQPGIADGIKKSGVQRDVFYLVTKVEETDDAYIATQNNLRQLELDFANLILIHRPPKQGVGKELWEGLQRARDEGFTRDIGVSNYSVEQIEELAELTGELPVVNQIEWSPFGFSQEMLAFCEENGIVIQAYSPLTRNRKIDDERLAKLASTYNKTSAQLLIRWNLQLGTVPLPKANQSVHLKENFDVFDFEISAEDMAALASFNEHFSTFGELSYV